MRRWVHRTLLRSRSSRSSWRRSSGDLPGGGGRSQVAEACHPPDAIDPGESQWPLVDQPIGASAADRLGRGPFAQRVTEVLGELQELEESSVLALVGPWGSGKSSLINLVCERLGESWQVRRANMWAPPDVSALLADLFATIRSALPDEKRTRRLKSQLGEYAQLAIPALSLIPVVGSAAKDVATNLFQHRPQEPMQSLFDQLSAQLRNLGLRVLVVLDDVDRLQPDELLVLFKAIRLVARFPGVYYLLAYDEQTIIDVLTRTVVAHDQSDRALAYLEKIVQVRLDLPPAERFYTEQMLNNGITNLMSRLGISLNDEQTARFRELYDKLLQHTLAQPRAVGRFLRQALAYLPMAEPGEVDVVDYLALTHLRSLVPATYRLLARSKSSLAVSLATPVESAPESMLGQVRNGLAKECSDFCDEVLAVIAELFPALDDAYLVDLQPFDWQHRAAARRAAIEEYFDRYFLFGLPADDIADSTALAALIAIAHEEESQARTEVEAQLAGNDPDRVDRIVRKLTRLSSDSTELDSSDLVAVLHYALALANNSRLPGRLLGSGEHQSVTWATAVLARLGSTGQSLDPDFAPSLSNASFSVLCQALRSAVLLPREGARPLIAALEQVARAACERIRDHLRARDDADLDLPIPLLAQFVNRSEARTTLAEMISADLDNDRFELADLAARFMIVGRFHGDREELIGFDHDALTALMGLPKLWLLSGTSQDHATSTDAPIDESDISWPSRRRAGLAQLRETLQQQRAVPPRPPSGVQTGGRLSPLQQTSPSQWGSQISHGAPASEDASIPVCLRAAVLLPGSATGLPSGQSSVAISEEARAQALIKILGEVPFTAWCIDKANASGIALQPEWSEEGYGNRIYAELALGSAGSDDPSPLRAHCMITTGSSPSPQSRSQDILAIGLDLVIRIPSPAGADQPKTTPVLYDEKLSIHELVKLAEIVTRSAIIVAKKSALELLKVRSEDGHLAVWLATTQSLDRVIDLAKFPMVGNQVAQSETVIFAALPLEPGQADDSGEFTRSLRGVAVELAHELLRTANRRDYIELLHALTA